METQVGWVEEIRDVGKIVFLVIFHPKGKFQAIVKKGNVDEKTWNNVKKLTRQSAVKLYGHWQENEQALQGKEFVVEKLEIESLAEKPLPLDPSGKTPAMLDTKLNWRFLDLRNQETLAIFKIQNKIIQGFREWLINNGFLEIQPPGIIASASEGGAELFPLPYFERQAYLAQSPQLYKQMAAISWHKVFCIMPVWRAEKFDQPTHLNEIRQMDVEIAFIEDEEDVLKVLEQLLKHIVDKVRNEAKEELKLLNVELEEIKLPIKRVTYKEAIEALQKKGEQIEFGDDFSKSQEKMLADIFGNVFILKDWPLSLKPFYAMPKNEEVAMAFDVIFNGLEISSGTVRINDPKLLEERIKANGLNPKNFETYINAFRYGAPRHGGFSFGLERLTMVITKRQNIREVTMWPRDRKRLEP